MHSSAFSYGLSRPYPFKWFTPTVVVGGIVAIVLVSLINVATAGYQLVSTTSTNPNKTQSGQSWIKGWPSFLIGQMHATCEPSTIPVGTQLYTNNSALSYTLRAVWQESDNGAPRTDLGSLVYHNNQLESCSIASVQIQMRSLGRSADQIALQQTGALLTAFTMCSIQTTQGAVMLNLTSDYELVINNGIPGFSFQTFMGRNATSKSSLYLGETLLTMYWIQLTNVYAAENQDSDYHLYEGYLSFNRKQTNEVDDIESLDFFTPDCYFVPFGSTGVETEVLYCGTGDTVAGLASGDNTAGGPPPLPDIWIPADSISKALYFTVLTDLGQHSQPNLLVNQSLLEYFTQNFTNISRSHEDKLDPWGENIFPGQTLLPSAPYTIADNSSTYYLGVNASTLTTSYLCQVPQPKPLASLVFAVLVADLVLLQGLWKSFTFIVDFIWGKRHPEMGYCKGCLEQKHGDVPVPDYDHAQLLRKGPYQHLTQADQASSIARE